MATYSFYELTYSTELPSGEVYTRRWPCRSDLLESILFRLISLSAINEIIIEHESWDDVVRMSKTGAMVSPF